MKNIVSTLIDHEGLRLLPYTDTTGNLTIGVGRNLSTKGITKEEALLMLNNDIAECKSQLKFKSFYINQSDVRKEVLIELCFNMGFSGLLTFKKFLAAMTAQNYELAIKELLDSKWATQISLDRKMDIVYRIKNGLYKT